MERQRSFSFKPTRLLVFSFTICSSVVFLTTFAFWVKKFSPSVHQQTHVQFNRSLSGGDGPLSLQNSTGFTRNFTVDGVKIPALIENRRGRSDNFSNGDSYSGSNSSVPEFGGHEARASVTNFTPMQDVVADESLSGVVRDKQGNTILGLDERTDGNRKEEFITAASFKKIEVLAGKKIGQKTVKGCDLTKGSWVFDESYPLYTKDSCPFIDEGFDCLGNGRLDSDYLKWRWQPQDCDLPRFNATKMLELIRGKRLVFVGDSINRNQWESLLCMLTGAIRDPKRVYETRGRKITKEKGNYSFRFLDYQCTVEFYVSHFLVHESKARIGQKRRPTLRIDAIDRGSSRWRGADILVFNTAHWWSHYKTKAGINYYQEGSLVHPQLNVSTAFRKALTTWSSWVDKHINARKTRVLFRSSAPSHFRGGQWNTGGHCKEATSPLNETLSTAEPEKNRIVEEVLKQMKTGVTLLDITRLSGYRIDGHPSIYGWKSGKNSKSQRIQDCSHWCLPGVPDTWNELLFYHVHATSK
ncbi:protein trichome birefringence-like 6 [Neltuma alba]|uniref:protein trichome birefringence-like 6 n=1 Tax=Neltuma alba TaxID=207710 RepID=UPI0010A50C60|nr:protein trichome birefringence-like 6 [Prosopis alba]XP_028797027.1 protein trichome birefringence-like 6 [Prosopis alba]